MSNLQINGDTLGVDNLLFRHYHVSLSSKTIQSNTQNLAFSPLVLDNSLPVSAQMCCFRGHTRFIVFYSITLIYNQTLFRNRL